MFITQSSQKVVTDLAEISQSNRLESKRQSGGTHNLPSISSIPVFRSRGISFDLHADKTAGRRLLRTKETTCLPNKYST